ncbi:competence protein CoiA [Lysinibacillus sp. NPDC096418]|uniref:competence protein CoiA n=1 Tax=Lysinibacillus sp. NPDC096418 TaxID=3364138 RepID=UPI0038100BFE
MLIALTEHSQRFISYEYTREALQKYREKGTFYCPQCHQPVRLKIGTINIPHFAHITNQSCDRLFAEGESVLHLKGKVQLFEWLKKLGHIVELEPYLVKLAQRPDMLLTVQERLIAFEYQCSAISYEKWRLRTDGYEKERIEALWLFQTPPKKSVTPGVQKVSIAPIMQQVMIHSSQGLPYLITYDANSSQFIYWSNLLHLQGHTFIAKVQCLPIEMQRYPLYEPKPLSRDDFKRYWQLYKKTGEQYMYQRLLRSKNGVQDPFLRSCYEMRFALESMPSYVGLPVKNIEAIPCFSVEWQTLLHYFCRQLQLHPNELCKDDVRLFLRQLDVEPTEGAIQAVKNYSMIFENVESGKDWMGYIYVHLFAFETSY